MSWWAWVLVGAILISTLHKLLPRGRDLHLGRLRERARQLGYRVELKGSALAADLPAGVVGYRLALPRIAQEHGFAYVRTDTGWSQLTGAAPSADLQTLLARLPAEAHLIERDTHFVTLYWREPNRVEVLERLHVTLQPLVDMPVGSTDRA